MLTQQKKRVSCQLKTHVCYFSCSTEVQVTIFISRKAEVVIPESVAELKLLQVSGDSIRTEKSFILSRLSPRMPWRAKEQEAGV